ncbi:hypothetical protein NKI54_30465 [Mesorhizobium sp. M0663]|uniref:hypothetical protein n=1 Tax=Mesorhizobium sp. M0663 TaxID=2956981 RepID=UPI003337A2DB
MWDERQLAALRAKYSDQGDREVFDPRFREIADGFYKSGARVAPYAGMRTFLSAPYQQIDPKRPEFGDLQVAILARPIHEQLGSLVAERSVKKV